MGILMDTSEVNLCTARYGSGTQMFGAMGTPSDAFYSDTIHTIAINTRETEFGKILEPIPITLKAYQQFQAHGYGFPQQMLTALTTVPRAPEIDRPSTSSHVHISPPKEDVKDSHIVRPPPKKKWIKEYLEEEPKSEVSVRVVTGLSVTARSNGVVRPTSPVPVTPAPATAPAIIFEPAPAPAPAPAAPPTPLLDFVQEHSRPRTTSTSHGTPQIPSPPSVGSNGSSSGSGSAPRAGTREVHNKLEKNRRAHLKECFELLKRQLPATPDDKKTSNLSILASAIRYIQVLRRKERECEHEMERLAREKIAAQQRLAALKREVSVRVATRPSAETEEMDRDDRVNGQVVGIPISITSSPPRVARIKTSPPRSLNLSTKLRTLPIQITPTTSQVVRTSYGSRHNTLTLTTLAPADSGQNGQLENGAGSTLGAATLVHPAQIHLPISQVVGGGGLVVGGALQLLAAGAGLRVLQPGARNGVTTGDSSHRIQRENGIVSPPPASSDGVVVSGLAPLVVSQPGAHLLQTHTLTHKMVETQVVKGGVTPLTVSAQYLSATTIVKPLVVLPPPAERAPDT